MSRFIKRFQDDDDEFTEEEIAAAELIVESTGDKKVVDTDVDVPFNANTCFICRREGLDGVLEPFQTNTGVYNLFVCNECKEAFKG